MARPLILALVALLSAAAGTAEAKTKNFVVKRAGEGRLALTLSAPGTGWERRGRESAVVAVSVDGRPVADVVAFMGARRFTYRVGLGRLGKGRHRVTAGFARAKSPRRARRVRVHARRFSTRATCPRSGGGSRTTAPTSRCSATTRSATSRPAAARSSTR
jgi:hypothetical protein